MNPKCYSTLAVIGRFKPLHIGGQHMLEAVCTAAEHVIIGLGSCNKYNIRNPFTSDESQAMIESALSTQFKNYSFRHISDFAHIPKYQDGQRWREEIKQQFGTLDGFVTANPYVTKLLETDYAIIHPIDLIPKHNWIYLNATMVRAAMAKGDDWKHYVSSPVEQYIRDNKLDLRFRKEFGLATLAQLREQTTLIDSLDQEKTNTRIP
jgi:nicotinamide mononucleotide adenylyltransferase